METFKKRQKEMRRQEKRQDKIAKRKARKAAGGTAQTENSQDAEPQAESLPAQEVSPYLN